MSKKLKEPEIVVKMKLVPLDCGTLSIETKYGRRIFYHDHAVPIPREEAEELIKVRTKQREASKRPGCDLVIVQDD